MALKVPDRHSPKLQQLTELVNADAELLQLWKCANINAVDRSGISDHGEVHVRIVANAGLRILRLLADAGVQPSVVANYGLTAEDAEVTVFLGACVHDLGIAISRDDHERYSLILALPKCRELLAALYSEPTLTVLVAEVLHTVIAHRWDVHCLTVEAGVVKVADALDMSQGRSRIPFKAGQVNIHSLSAQAIEDVAIEKGADKPVRIAITMRDSAGIFQVDELLRRKLANSTLASYVEVVARIAGTEGKQLIEIYKH